MSPTTSHHLYPPFPDDIETAPLVSISLAKLEKNDKAESDSFFKACRGLGFFYMNMEGSTLGDSLVSEAEQLQNLQKQFFKVPHEEKEVFSREKIDPFFGYRHSQLELKNEDGSLKRNETYNVRSSSLGPDNSGLCLLLVLRCGKTTSSATVSLFRATTSSSKIGRSSSLMHATAVLPLI
jgi:hypothetical protein